MNRSEYLKNFGTLEKKDKRYYLFRAFLLCLNVQETRDLIQIDFSQDILTRFLITKKIIDDLKVGQNKNLTKLVEEILERIATLTSYHKKQAASKFLTEIFDFLEPEYQDTVMAYLFNSPYINDRKRSYGLLMKKFDESYTEKLLEHLNQYDGDYPLAVIVSCCQPKVLNENFDLINKYFEDDLIQYDWQLLKIRTKFYARLLNLRPKFINQLKQKDPISYMYVMKETGKKIDSDMAWKAFMANPNRSSLFRLFSDLKLWDVLIKIDRYQKSH